MVSEDEEDDPGEKQPEGSPRILFGLGGKVLPVEPGGSAGAMREGF
jgi:hypothetical protein